MIVSLFILYYLAKIGIEYWFDTRAEYEEIAEAEAEALKKAEDKA